MLDRYLYPLLGRGLRPVARHLVQRGVTADQITVGGFLFGLTALPLLWADAFGLALLAILLNRIADGLDGAVARATRPTDRGAFLDIALDFFFYATVPLGFALADPARNALPAACLITAFVGTGSSFLAFAAIAGKRGLEPDAYPSKGLFYLGGLTEGFETIAVFCLMCLFPVAFPTLALIFAAACLLTTATRWLAGWRLFASGAPSDSAQIADS